MSPLPPVAQGLSGTVRQKLAPRLRSPHQVQSWPEGSTLQTPVESNPSWSSTISFTTTRWCLGGSRSTSSRNLFDGMQILQDLWWSSWIDFLHVRFVHMYMLSYKYTTDCFFDFFARIPNEWQQTMKEFYQELKDEALDAATMYMANYTLIQQLQHSKTMVTMPYNLPLQVLGSTALTEQLIALQTGEHGGGELKRTKLEAKSEVWRVFLCNTWENTSPCDN